MTKAYTGGCACGAIRYETKNEPIFENHCQCRECQKLSGTGHGSYLTFPSRQAVTLKGEASLWSSIADSGQQKSRGFCPACGTPVYITFAAMPDIFTVHAASLDEPARFSPQAVTYGMRALPWDRLDPALATFPKMPG